MIRHEDTALIELPAQTLDAAGRPLDGASTWVEFPCRTEPLSAEEAAALGNGTADVERVKVFAKDWPGSPIGVIEVAGQRWRQVGPAQRHRTGALTRHVTAVLEAL